MNISELYYRLTGKGAPDRLYRSDSSPVKQCPQEDEFLDYSQGRLSGKREARLERHLVGCEDCREFLALYAQLSEEQPQVLTPSLEPVSDEVVRKQTARILTLIKEDDFDSWQQASVEKARKGVRISYAQMATAAVALIAVAVTAYWFLKGPSYEDIAARSIALASKNERQIEPRISGNIAWSRYSIERGEEDDEKLALSRAMNRLKSAEETSANDSDRLALARVYLASGERERAARALVILQELMAGGNRSPAVLNDAGVALFQSRSYREAASLFAEAVEKAPDYEEALFNKALANHRAELIDEAKRDWTEFIQKASDEKWKEEAKNYLELLNRSSSQ